MAIAHTFRLRTQPAPPSVVYFELTLLPRALPFTDEAAARAASLYDVFERFGESDDAVSNLGMMSWHVTPEPAGQGEWGTKVEVLGQFIGSSKEFEVVMGKFERRLRARGELKYHLGSRQLCESSEPSGPTAFELTAAFLQSMHQVGGNWTRLEDRGPLNINEHVNFYAKVSKATHSHVEHFTTRTTPVPRAEPMTRACSQNILSPPIVYIRISAISFLSHPTTTPLPALTGSSCRLSSAVPNRRSRSDQ